MAVQGGKRANVTLMVICSLHAGPGRDPPAAPAAASVCSSTISLTPSLLPASAPRRLTFHPNGTLTEPGGKPILLRGFIRAGRSEDSGHASWTGDTPLSADE